MGKRLIPFGFLPGHWGLKGKVREKARIYYEIDDPEQQEIEIAKIDYEGREKDLELVILDIKLKYGKIEKDEYYEKKYKILYENDPEQYQKVLLKYKYESGKINEHEYEKELAEIENRPWVCVVKSSFNQEGEIGDLLLELDWNSHFIKFLKERGFYGNTEEQIVDMWLTELCKSIAEEDNYNAETLRNKGNFIVNSDVVRRTNKLKIDDDSELYS